MTDVLAALDRASLELSPELQVIWMRFRHKVVEAISITGYTPTPFVYVSRDGFIRGKGPINVSCYGVKKWRKAKEPAPDAVRFITEFFRGESRLRCGMAATNT